VAVEPPCGCHKRWHAHQPTLSLTLPQLKEGKYSIQRRRCPKCQAKFVFRIDKSGEPMETHVITLIAGTRNGE
jgi:hypothetical protein